MLKPRILIVEDDGDLVDLIATALGSDFECYGARDGREGIQQAQRGEPDLILCDIMMPVMDGREFLRRLRFFDGLDTVPVIFLTALTSREQIRDGYELGAGLYLTKPIDPTRLRRNIDLFIEDHGIEPRTKRLSFDELVLAMDPPREESRPARPAEAAPAPPATETQSRLRPRSAAPGRTIPGGHGPIPGRYGQSWMRMRILVADADGHTRGAIGSALGEACELLDAVDGMAALEMAGRYKPDVIVIDAMLPRLNGYQTVKLLRRDRDFQRTPIVFLSCKADVRDQLYAQRMGASYCLAKPVSPPEFSELIDQIISHPKFSIRRDRIGMDQAHLEQIQHHEIHRDHLMGSEAPASADVKTSTARRFGP